MREREAFYSENHSVSGIEPWLDRHLFQRMVRRIPHWVSPNALSILNHVVTWTVLCLAGIAPGLGPTGSLLARLGAAVGVFACVCLDCLDGMHARRTGQASRLGEVMDHWLDALNVPLMTAAMVLTLDLDPLTGAFALVAGTVPYNAQLVLYHHTGRFVHPHTSGIDGQVYLAIAYVILGVTFFFVPQSHPWAVRGVTLFAWAGGALAVSTDWFYIPRLRGFLRPHLTFLAVCGAFSALYVMGLLNAWAFVVGIVLLSFRVTGTYVLRTVVGRDYGGMDPVIPVGIAVLAVASLLPTSVALVGWSVHAVLPWLFLAWLAGGNLADFFRELGGLRATHREAPERGAAS